MRLFIQLFVFIFLLSWGSIRAEVGVELFVHYTSEDGMCSDNVHDMAQDKHGFIWIATQYGLSRFDGHYFKNFYEADYPSMFRNDIYHAFLLPDNRMAFAGGMLVAYNEEKNCFDDLSPEIGDTEQIRDVTGFYLMNNKEVYISFINGIFRYDRHQKIVKPISKRETKHRVLELWQDAYGRYWEGSDSGVFITDEAGSVIPGYEFMSDLGEMINNILPMDEHRVFLCSTVGSLWMAEIDRTGRILRPKKLNTPFKNISEIMCDGRGQFWFGTLGNGLWRMTGKNGQFFYRKVTPHNSNVDELSKITSLFEDSQGNIWIGTQNFGIWCLLSQENSTSYSSADLGIPRVKGSSFCEGKNGEFLFGTDGNGLYRLSSDYEILKHYTEKEGLPCNNILDIKKKNDDFILSFWGGCLSLLDGKTGTIEKWNSESVPTPLSRTKSVLIDNLGTIWAGTSGNGVYNHTGLNGWKQFLLNDASMKNHPDIWINKICTSNKVTRWIISSRTIWMEKNGHFRSVFPDIDKTVSKNPLVMNDGACDSSGHFFVATSKGILHFLSDGSSYEWLGFVPKGEYFSILIDSKNNLWTSGTAGVLSIDCSARKYCIHTMGKQCHGHDFFVERASFQDSKGRIFFGSKEGFVTFETTEKESDANIGYLAFADLYLMKKRPNPASELLSINLCNRKEIEVNHDHTNMTITFDLVDFSHQKNVELAYRIIGLDSVWLNLGASREVKIAHLPVGQYRLEVKAERFASENSCRTISLDITILPPWWGTWWFRTLIALLLISLFFLILYMRFRNIILQHERLQMMVSQRTEELNDANLTLQKQKQEIESRNEVLVLAMKNKDQLVSVVAHDLKNPMFAIVGALKTVLDEKESENTKEKILRNVYLSANALQSEMVKLLDWATARQTKVACQPQNTDLCELASEVISLLHGLAEEKQIRIDLECRLAHYAFADARMVSTILRNILTNAIKFTPHGKWIKVELTESDNEVSVCIKDSGIGMTEDQREKLLSSRQTISSRGTDNEWGSGLGFRIIKDFVDRNNGRLDVQSQQGQGTSVSIYLPVSKQTLNVKPQIQDEIYNLPVNKEFLSDKSILVIDDDPLILLHLRNILHPYVSVLEAHNGEEGLAEAKSKVPDLIVSDVEMPKKDGIEMFRNLKENTHTSNIPLLFLSANNGTNVRLSGFESGAIDYIAKPFDDKEFILKVCNILLWQRNQQMQILSNAYNNDETHNDNINPLLNQLLEVIKENYDCPDFSFDNIATALGMSKSTLSRRLKSLTDKTPIEILSEYRLNKARQLLKGTQLTVSEVAYHVGFNDPLYFSRKYKETFGISPSERDRI